MKRRDWPNNAKAARDGAIIEAIAGLRQLSPLLTQDCTKEELYRRIGLAMNSFNKIQLLLNQFPKREENGNNPDDSTAI